MTATVFVAAAITRDAAGHLAVVRHVRLRADDTDAAAKQVRERFPGREITVREAGSTDKQGWLP